ncbi:olfactory receptor 51G2-like [Carettochelys insculpta]|uniref:olfactory receptor 51G2-like n=1 Tax=Carettochelys insculpta TaxID=44489 RepID=UPI003EBD5FEA
MSALNDTKFSSAVFLLTGIPGFEDIHLWLSIPFCLTYIISVVGNSFILSIIKTDTSLHEPMYIFLSMLAITDIGILIATMPTVLGIYMFNYTQISFNDCFAQLFFIHFLHCTESSLLLLMAFDRYVAICDPLRYTSILTLPRVSKMGLLCIIRGVALIVPLPLLLKRYQYCQTGVLSHSYCLHQDVMKTACSDITISSICGLAVRLLIMGLDSLLIFLSYMIILSTVVSIVSPTECLKALNTCVSHLCAVLIFYTPEIGLSFISRFVKGSSPMLSVLLSYMSVLVPPLLNPIVYSVKSKHLRVRIIKVFLN